MKLQSRQNSIFHYRKSITLYKLTLIDEETNEEYEVKMDMDGLTINQFGLKLVKSNGKQVYFTNKLWKKVEINTNIPTKTKIKINGNEEYFVVKVDIDQNGIIYCSTEDENSYWILYYNPLFVSYFKVD